MCRSQFFFQTGSDLIGLTLTFIHVIAQCFFTFTMTHLTRTVYHGKRTLDVMVTEFHSSLTLIRHVTIGTRYSSLSVNAHLRNFIVRMLCLENRCTAQSMRIVRKAGFIVILLDSLYRHALVPWESEVLAVSFKVIFHMTLCTHQRAHFLRSDFCDVFSLTGKSFIRAGRLICKSIVSES